jgi:hypothetical protein
VHAFVKRAHAVTDRQARIPAAADEGLDRRALGGVRRCRSEDQQVDVGVREDLAAPVAADRCDQRAAGQPGAAPELPDRRVGDGAQSAHQAVGVEVAAEGVDQFVGLPPVRDAQPAERLRLQTRHGGLRRRGRAATAARACPPMPSAPRSQSRSPAPCAPTGRRGYGPW